MFPLAILQSNVAGQCDFDVTENDRNLSIFNRCKGL
jgi:hypothetical protein